MDDEQELAYTCLICQTPIWPQDGGLCFEHGMFALLWSEVATGRLSDWEPNTGGYVSHPVMQTDATCGASKPWQVVIGDINRLARWWLDDWHGDDDERGVAA